MQLVLEGCTIRPWQLDDAESLAKHANNRKVWLALRDLFPHPYTIQDGIGIRLGQDVHRHTASLGYWLGEEFWGRGIMTEAVAAFTDFCFENFPLRRISAEVFANNPASARVLEKTGFIFEGRLKNNVVKDGELLDSLLYAKKK
jgi:ribosomal-protein-alanine N-acetyltransferase